MTVYSGWNDGAKLAPPLTIKRGPSLSKPQLNLIRRQRSQGFIVSEIGLQFDPPMTGPGIWRHVSQVKKAYRPRGKLARVLTLLKLGSSPRQIRDILGLTKGHFESAKHVLRAKGAWPPR